MGSIDVETYYRTYGPMVLRRCRRMLGDEERALDAMQDTFVKLLANQDKLVGTAPSSLLYRIATNTCLNILRSQRRRPEDADSELLNRIAAIAPEIDARASASGILARLFRRETESTRVIAVMHLLDGMTLAEVAAEVGLSVSGVRKRLRILRGHLHALEGV